MFKTLLRLAASLIGGCLALPANSTATAPFESVPKPKLLLVIIVDQFRYDYLMRFAEGYTGGIARLLKDGAVFTDARYTQAHTFTATGHATVLTGATPALSGIVANEWFEREPDIARSVECPLLGDASVQAKPNKIVESISDDGTCLLGADANRHGSSPRRLLVSTIGDELKMAGRKSKVFGISLKDRGAILTAGRMADAAYWFEKDAFVTSTYYMAAIPGWVAAFNAGKPVDRFKDADWRAVDAAEGSPPFCSRAKDIIIDGSPVRSCPTFTATPFANEVLETFAEQLVERENLGGSPDTDLLSVSFSANDILGHLVGPDAPEVRDMSLRTDRVIGKLLSYLEARLGRDAALVVFTADHGVAPAPKLNAARKMPGGWIDGDAVKQAVTGALNAKFGTAEWIEQRVLDGLYLNMNVAASQHVAASEVRKVAAESARSFPHIARAFTSDDLSPGFGSADPIAAAVQAGFYPGRSPDVILVPEPYFMFGGKTLSQFAGGTTHGTPYSYDNHVPLIFLGSGIKQGYYDSRVHVIDVAPTLARILAIETPSGSMGRVLLEMFDGAR